MHAPGPADADVVEALRREFGAERVRVDGASAGQRVQVVFRIRGREERFGAILPLPSLGEPTPWLYSEPAHADDWVVQFGIWLDEERETDCASWARQREHDGVRWFEVAPYGFRVADDAEHGRLLQGATGPGGRWTDVREEGAAR